MSESREPALTSHPLLPLEVRIVDVVDEIDGVSTYDLAFCEPQHGGNFRFQPGQFNMLYVPGVGEIPISLSADPDTTGSWAHTIRLAGNTTRAIATLGAGGVLGLRGPYGSAWPMETCRGRDVLIVAGGIGLAPLRPAIYAVLADREAFGSVTLLYGARNPDSLLFTREFETWRRGGVDILATVDRANDDWTGDVGVVPLLLERLPWNNAPQTVMLMCGPEVMMRYSATAAERRGLERDHIWLSLERNMQCAVGWCGHCQLGSAFICRDGPILRYDQICELLPVEGL